MSGYCLIMSVLGCRVLGEAKQALVRTPFSALSELASSRRRTTLDTESFGGNALGGNTRSHPEHDG